MFAGLQSVLSGLWYWAHRSRFNLQLTLFPQPGPLQGTPRKSSNFKPTPRTLTSKKKLAQGTQKATKKTSKSRLDIIQFTKHVKKLNLTKTIVFVMFSAHPTSESGVICSPKPIKTHTSKPTLQTSRPKPEKNN